MEKQSIKQARLENIEIILESLRTLKKKKLDFMDFSQKTKKRYETNNLDLEQRERFLRKYWDENIKPIIDSVLQRLTPLWDVISAKGTGKWQLAALKDMISCNYEWTSEKGKMEVYMAALIEEFEAVKRNITQAETASGGEAGGGDLANGKPIINIGKFQGVLGDVQQTENLQIGDHAHIHKHDGGEKKKKGIIWRFLKIIGAITAFFAALLTCLYYLGWLEPIKEFISKMLWPK